MKKFVRIKFSNGEVYDIPAEIIAKERTDYYSIEVDGHSADSPEWLEEYNYSINDGYELRDWLSNNMNWKDVKDKATLVKEESIFNYEDDFINTEKSVVEHD